MDNYIFVKDLQVKEKKILKINILTKNDLPYIILELRIILSI